MKKVISRANPFRSTFRCDHAFVWEELGKLGRERDGHVKVLDYGAHDGKMLQACLDSELRLHAFGVDANNAALARGRLAVRAGQAVTLGTVAQVEEFSEAVDGFDFVTLMGVLEHVRDQEALLCRLRAVLVPRGRLIISVPGRHFLSWLDFGNWKFYFPRLHRYFIRLTKGERYYAEKFVECRDGLFGDIEVGKNEHEHFSVEELVRLVERCGFRVEVSDGYGRFYRLLHNVWWLSPGRLKRLWIPLILADLRSGASAEIIVVASRSG